MIHLRSSTVRAARATALFAAVLVLLLGPWALALMATVVFGILALFGAGPIAG